MTLRNAIPVLLVSSLSALLLSGCAAVAGAGAVVGISAVRQERSVADAVDDLRIKTALDSKFAPAGLYFDLHTTVVEGRVLLAGRVQSPEERLEATRIAWSVEGVRKVDNDIEVSDYSGWLDRPSDLTMRAQLALVLLGDRSIKDVNYTTDVIHGVVYLVGVGQDQAEIDRAIAHAWRLKGVKRVESYVVLKDDPVRTESSGQTAQR